MLKRVPQQGKVLKRVSQLAERGFQRHRKKNLLVREIGEAVETLGVGFIFSSKEGEKKEKRTGRGGKTENQKSHYISKTFKNLKNSKQIT